MGIYKLLRNLADIVGPVRTFHFAVSTSDFPANTLPDPEIELPEYFVAGPPIVAAQLEN